MTTAQTRKVVDKVFGNNEAFEKLDEASNDNSSLAHSVLATLDKIHDVPVESAGTFMFHIPENDDEFSEDALQLAVAPVKHIPVDPKGYIADHYALDDGFKKFIGDSKALKILFETLESQGGPMGAFRLYDHRMGGEVIVSDFTYRGKQYSLRILVLPNPNRKNKPESA